MRIALNKVDGRVGGVLVTTLVVCVLVGLMLMAYLSMLSNQHKLSQRSQVWNNCIPMCEAGVEEALAHLNHVNTTSNFAINGWVFDNGAYRKERALNGGVNRMSINTNNPPVITVSGTLRPPAQDGSLTRAVRVKTRLNQKFPNGILSKGTVKLGGSGRIDSFNSTILTESDALGQYNPLTATDRATVVTTSTAAGVINVGNMSIYGSIATGPGGTADISPQGNVGSTLFNDSGLNEGEIEAGHSTDDVNVYVPDATMPSQWGPANTPTSEVVDGVLYKYVIRDGDWQISSVGLASGEKMLITGQARLWVQGQTSVSGQITVAASSSMEWYASGSVGIGGNGVVNTPGLAKNFSIIGLNTCTSVSYSGTSRFIGTVYAPRAVVKLSGTSDAYGAIVGSSVELVGGMGLHYDESLKGDPRKARFIAASWQEL